MTENQEKRIDTVKKFLESYGINKKLLTMMHYEKEFFSRNSEADEIRLIPGGDEVFIKSKMLLIRRFVASLDEGDCKLLLFYHYIKGYSVEKCAEMMNIGRTSGYRIKKRALSMAADKYFIHKSSDFAA